jgi:hypothetical protein
VWGRKKERGVFAANDEDGEEERREEEEREEESMLSSDSNRSATRMQPSGDSSNLYGSIDPLSGSPISLSIFPRFPFSKHSLPRMLLLSVKVQKSWEPNR